MRRYCLRLERWENPPLSYLKDMKNKIISVFIDESGNFGDLKDPARYCIVTLVLHDQSIDITRQIAELDRANEDLGLDPEHFIFHTAPLIRQDGAFVAMSRRMRARILDRMLTFVRHADFRFTSFSIDTRFLDDESQITDKLSARLAEFAAESCAGLTAGDTIKVYYDAGQKTVTKMLSAAFDRNRLGVDVVFSQGVEHSKYKMLQVADLICTLELMALRIKDGTGLNIAEKRFFGNPRILRRNIFKIIEHKRI